MAEAYRTTRLVEFHDTDMAGIMHFASFFHYMESAEHEFLRSRGLSVHPHGAAETVSFPRVSAQCDYRSPALCEEVLDIAITLERVGTKSISYRFDVTASGREVAIGKIVCVCCRIVPGKPPVSIPIPAEMRELLLAARSA